MNTPKIFEGALAATIVATADLTDLPRIRTWQAIDQNDARWTPVDDRTFPVFDIKGRPPTNADDGLESTVALVILVGTHADGDKTHEKASLYYAVMQKLIENLYAQQRKNTTGAERNAWNTYIEDNFPVENAIFNGSVAFTMGDGQDPYEDAGINQIGLTLLVHYHRTDW